MDFRYQSKVFSVLKSMKGFLIVLFIFSFFNGFTQNFYLQINASNSREDSLLSIYAKNIIYKDIKSLKQGSSNLIEELQMKGYFNIRLDTLKAVNDSVYKLNLKLNQKYNTVSINNYEVYADVIEGVDSYIKVSNLPQQLNAILNQLSQQGKPFSQIKLSNIQLHNSDTISADLVLDQSLKRTLDAIVIRGFDKFPKAFLKNYAGLKKGDIFNREKLIKKSERLNALAFVKQSKTPQVQFTKDSTKLFLYLEKTQANSFDGFLGFNNSDENDLQINGNIDLTLINNFNGGEQINLNYRNDGNAQEWFDVGIRLPYIFKSRFSIEAGLGFFKQDSTFSNNTQHLKLDYQVGQSINIGATASFETSTNLLDENNFNQDIQDFTKSRYGVEAVYLNPKRYSRLFLNSQYFNIGVGVGSRETKTLKEDQQYINLEARQIFKLDKRQYIYIGLNGGFLNSDSFLSNELYRFGGVNSMRGFAENRFFANLFGTIQTEYRYVLGSNLYIHSVLDYGFYENDVDRFSENLYSLGLGFGLETQAGVLRLIFANGGSDSQNLEFKNTQIHLKFISVF